MYGNDSGAQLAYTGAGISILGMSIPMPALLSAGIILVGVGAFLLVAWRKRSR